MRMPKIEAETIAAALGVNLDGSELTEDAAILFNTKGQIEMTLRLKDEQPEIINFLNIWLQTNSTYLALMGFPKSAHQHVNKLALELVFTIYHMVEAQLERNEVSELENIFNPSERV